MRQKLIVSLLATIAVAIAFSVWLQQKEPDIWWPAAIGLSWPMLVVLVAVLSLFLDRHRVLSSLLAAAAGVSATWWVIYQFPGADWSNFGWAWSGFTLLVGAIGLLVLVLYYIVQLTSDGSAEDSGNGSPDTDSPTSSERDLGMSQSDLLAQ